MKNNQTSGQKKLRSLGLQLPLFPTTSVGSLPKQPDLIELRYKVSKGVQQPSELERKEKISMEVWIREQERMGLDVLVDGEIYRSDLVNFFAHHIDGFETGGMVRSYGNRYYRKPVIKGKLGWKGPITTPNWKYAQRTSHKPVKAIVTGPYTLMDWSFNEHYSSRTAVCQDLYPLIRKEILQLVEAGVKILQIDEPALSARPNEFSLFSDCLKELTKGLKCYVVLHHCYGNLVPIWSKLIRLPVNNFSLEAANSNFSVLSLLKKYPTKKDLSLGLVDSHSHVVETPQQIHGRIKSALKFIPARQLWLSPDCGLKTRSSEEAIGKLKGLVFSAEKFRKKRYC